MSKLRSQLNNLTAGATSSQGVRSDQHSVNMSSANPANSRLSPESHLENDGGNNGQRAGTLTSRNMSAPNENRNDENRRELAEIKSTLQNLTQKLAGAGNNSNAGSTNNSNAPSTQSNAKGIDTDVLAGSLAQSLRENLRDQMATEIDKMRQELGTLQQSANKANDRVILDDIQRISEGIHELQSRQVVSPDQFGEMAGELRGIHRDIRSLAERPQPQFDAQEISNSIQASYDEIAKRLDCLGSSQVGNHIEALSEKLEAIKESIPTTDQQTLLRIENQLQALSTGITALVDNDVPDAAESIDSLLPGYFESLDRRMDEITRAVMASASTEKDTSDESAFDRIEARIASLAKSVDGLSYDGAPTQENPQLADLMRMPEKLQSTLAKLEERVAQLSTSSIVDDTQINEEFGSQLASLTQKIDQLQLASTTHETNAIDSEIAAKLDALSHTLERAINSGDGSVGQLESQIAELSNRIEQAVSADQAEQKTRLQNESRIVEELQALAARVELIDSAHVNTEPHDLQLSALEDQITSIASQLQSIGGQTDLSAIETRLGGIEEQFAASRDVAIEAANHALQQAGTMNDGENYNSVISALAEDLKILTRSSTELKGHSLETFDAVRDSLSMILDRINSIEVRIANEELSSGFAGSAPAPHNEIPNADMVDAAREYASSLAAQDAGVQYQKASATIVADDDSKRDEPADDTALPIVEAPSLDLQHLPEMENLPAQTEELAGDDLPLEPGSGAPDLAGNGPNMDSLMRQAKENKRKETLEDEQQNPTDFIAAARRAAQAAANEENMLNAAAEKKAKAGHRFSFKEFMSRRKKSVMFFVATIVVAALAFSVIKYFPSTGLPQVVQSEQLDVEPAAQVAETGSMLQNPQDIQSETAGQQVSNPAGSTELAIIEQPPNDALQQPVLIPDTNAVVAESMDVTLTPSSETPQAQAITLAPMPPEEVGPIALRQAAASGDPKALFEVGRRYTTGINGTPDLEEAVKWYERAANSNFAPAQYRLGNFYEKGHGVTSDVNKAATWYKRAADQGNALAMHNLAVINAMGVLDGGANMVEASSWFQKAAEHGVKDSQVNLGIVYAKAMGVEVDLAQAYKWFAIAAKAGDKDAAQKRDTVAKQMRPDQLEQARGEVELWRPLELNADANSVDIPAEWNTVSDVTASLTSTQMIQKTQAILIKLGFKPGPADGVMGAKTSKAIKKFQARAGIAVNGKVTPDLVSALEKAKI